MGRTPTPRDPGFDEIDQWISWFRGAQKTVICEHTMSDDERVRALAEADRLSDAIHARMVHDYTIRTAPR
jgi:hypothetical protein